MKIRRPKILLILVVVAVLVLAYFKAVEVYKEQEKRIACRWLEASLYSKPFDMANSYTVKTLCWSQENGTKSIKTTLAKSQRNTKK